MNCAYSERLTMKALRFATAFVWVLCFACQSTVANPDYVRCRDHLCESLCLPEERVEYCQGWPDDPNCKKCGDGYVVDSGAADGAVGSADGAVDASDGSVGDAGTSDGGADACAVSTWYADSDGDGLGDPAESATTCAPPSGYVDNSNDPYPACGRAKAPAGCAIGAMRCVGDTVGDREICTEDSTFPGCTDWVAGSDCEANAPVCSGDGECGSCGQDADCAGFPGTPSCSASGACVECTPATETTACGPSKGNRACDPVALTCTGEPRGTVGTCGRPITAGDKRVVPCVSDSECAEGNKCLVMSFNDQPYGSYCLQIAPVGLCPDQFAAKKSATSVGGIVGNYCFPREKLTTCEAVIGFAAPCTTDADCGRAEVDDGHCEGPDGAKACTYACSGDRDCSGTTCTNFGSDKYCNPN